jgi:hypothetical protein
MITFRQHLDISKYAEKEGGIIEYIGKLEASERVGVTRSIKETYPLKEPLTNHYEALDNFKCHFRVNDLVLGQFIMIEQIITGKTKYPTEAENDFALAQLLMRPNNHDVFDNNEALFQQQWYWYSMVRMLAKEDITKYDEIYMLNMGTVMPEMSFLAQKSKIEAARQRQSEAMRKL